MEWRSLECFIEMKHAKLLSMFVNAFLKGLGQEHAKAVMGRSEMDFVTLKIAGRVSVRIRPPASWWLVSFCASLNAALKCFEEV